MKGESVIYNNRIVPKANFRVFVYGADNTKQLATSWHDYEYLIQSGTWFTNKNDVPEKLKAVNGCYKKRGGE